MGSKSAKSNTSTPNPRKRVSIGGGGVSIGGGSGGGNSFINIIRTDKPETTGTTPATSTGISTGGVEIRVGDVADTSGAHPMQGEVDEYTRQQKLMQDLIKRERQMTLLKMAETQDEIARRRNRYLSSRVGRRGLIASGSPGTGLSKTVTDRGFMTLGGT